MVILLARRLAKGTHPLEYCVHLQLEEHSASEDWGGLQALNNLQQSAPSRTGAWEEASVASNAFHCWSFLFVCLFTWCSPLSAPGTSYST